MSQESSGSHPALVISSDDATAAAPPPAGSPPKSPPANKRLLPSIMFSSMALFATYAGLIAVLLPSQVALLDEENKVANLAIVTTTSFVFTLFAQPIVGALSDRTRSKLGRRIPWMIFGALIGGILILGIGSLKSLLWITVFWVLIQVALNALQGPLSAITPDRFPKSKLGIASAMSGVGMQIGGTIGVLVAGALAATLGMAYSVFGVLIIVAIVLFVLLNHDWSSKESSVPPFSWSRFFKDFWIDPKANPDFAWAFAARFLFILGQFAISAFQLYILTDYIHLPLVQAQFGMGTLALAAFVPTLATIALAGWWSDKIGRRKVFIYCATIIMVVSLVIPLAMPTFNGLIIYSIINGIGFGLYMSADTALMNEVLPGAGAAAGKDLGILNVATNIPQAMSPAIAALVISLGGYPALFIFSMVLVVIAALAVIPIKSVR